MRLERLEFAHIACATLWRALAMSLWSPDRQLYQHSFGIRRRSLGMHPINPLAVVLDVEARDSITAGVTSPRLGLQGDGHGGAKMTMYFRLSVTAGATAWRRALAG